MLRFVLVQNRQGKTRLSKFYVPYEEDEKSRIRGEVHSTGTTRSSTEDTPGSSLAYAFFGNVCELDLVFNFYKVYAILDECFLAGEVEETSKKVILERLDYLDKLE
ncbi:AP-2 complex subunit sigma [Rhodotorula mucilaginosa]|uniref:AP complex subunit sigma n=1 Tax=Rhodotorula mucilaginosa TaxID=5537 RepID=A0A9P6VVN1_RHOMI|nr:AP-2 complex subunit sigma [Rhodotorula mucilaginosa]